MSLRVYVKKVSTRKAALSYAVLTWQTEWPSWLGKNLVFRGAQRGLSMRPAQCTTAPSYGPVGGQQRADIIAWAGPGQRVGEASEVGQARSPRRSSRQPQKTANQPQAFGARLMTVSQLLSRSPVLFSLSQCREAPVPLPCQDAHRAAPSCVTAPPSLFGGRPCSSWTWSAVSPNVRTGGRRPRCKGKLRLRGFVVCV